jgi:hypothetical protein
VRRAWTSSVASQTPREADGRGRPRVGQRAVGDVVELLALRAEEPAQPGVREGGAHLADPHPAEARDVLARRGAEGAQVAPEEVVQRAGAPDERLDLAAVDGRPQPDVGSTGA